MECSESLLLRLLRSLASWCGVGPLAPPPVAGVETAPARPAGSLAGSGAGPAGPQPTMAAATQHSRDTSASTAASFNMKRSATSLRYTPRRKVELER